MSETRLITPRKRIALVAHDKKKADLMSWAEKNKEALAGHELLGTGTTGKMLEEKLGLPVSKLFSGPLGGDQQVGSMIAEGKLDFLVFFWDPMESQAHDSDVKALLRIAVAWNILIANNRTTADFILKSQLMDKDYELATPDYSKYLQRTI
jgi:methylglyoxal synthase